MESLFGKSFPLMVSEPRNMKPLEQVVCMVNLADDNTLEELRKRQFLIEEQYSYLIEHEYDIESFEDLEAMQSTIDAAVAYQTFDDTFWMAFIKK